MGSASTLLRCDRAAATSSQANALALGAFILEILLRFGTVASFGRHLTVGRCQLIQPHSWRSCLQLHWLKGCLACMAGHARLFWVGARITATARTRTTGRGLCVPPRPGSGS